MRLFRFMSISEFRNYLHGQSIEGKFVKGKACFLEENIPARQKDPSIKELTDLKSLNFTSTDFDGQMKELSELISPIFENGDFEGQLKDLEYLTLADFMKDVREGASAEVLVEFETTDTFEQNYNKVIMAYQQHLIQEIQSNSYNIDTLHCISYKIDLINKFKNGIGADMLQKKIFEGVENALSDIEHEEQLLLESKHNSLQEGKSGYADCMEDLLVKISTEQEATNVIKQANIDKEHISSYTEERAGD